MSTFTGVINAVYSNLTKFGQRVTLRKRVTDSTTYDPATGTPTVSITDVSLVGVLTDYTKREMAGTEIQDTDRRFIAAAKGVSVVPAPGDEIVINDLTMKIVSANIAEPNGERIYFDLTVRAGV